MSKKGGLGSKRIGSMTSKGMGKCPAGTRGEQCGNARGLGKGKGENMHLEKEQSYITKENLSIGTPEHLTSIQTQLSTLELDLNKIREKLTKLKEGH